MKQFRCHFSLLDNIFKHLKKNIKVFQSFTFRGFNHNDSINHQREEPDSGKILGVPITELLATDSLARQRLQRRWVPR